MEGPVLFYQIWYGTTLGEDHDKSDKRASSHPIQVYLCLDELRRFKIGRRWSYVVNRIVWRQFSNDFMASCIHPFPMKYFLMIQCTSLFCIIEISREAALFTLFLNKHRRIFESWLIISPKWSFFVICWTSLHDGFKALLRKHNGCCLAHSMMCRSYFTLNLYGPGRRWIYCRAP